MFEDREDAARQLATALAVYRGQRPLIIAIPRGAVPMGRMLADLLDGELDVVLVRKLGAPLEPEVAIGAVDESGWSYIAPFAAELGANHDYIVEETRRQMATIRERRARYSPIHHPVDPAGRVVIVVDDGLATGATMQAALHGLRRRRPARLVCAVPVASPRALDRIRDGTDEVVCLLAPDDFQAVGQYYRFFPQVSDEEVEGLLRG
jgi:putative phosphoribosyl transferase